MADPSREKRDVYVIVENVEDFDLIARAAKFNVQLLVEMHDVKRGRYVSS